MAGIFAITILGIQIDIINNGSVLLPKRMGIKFDITVEGEK
jgi:hypothetical protein